MDPTCVDLTSTGAIAPALAFLGLRVVLLVLDRVKPTAAWARVTADVLGTVLGGRERRFAAWPGGEQPKEPQP